MPLSAFLGDDADIFNWFVFAAILFTIIIVVFSSIDWNELLRSSTTYESNLNCA